MYIVQYHDYEWSDLIGVFDNMDQVYAYMTINGKMKPQDHSVQKMITHTTFEDVITDTWCREDNCNTVIYGHREASDYYCDVHLPIVRARRAEQNRLYILRQQKWEEGREEREKKEREDYAKFISSIEMSGSVGVYTMGEPMSFENFKQNPCREVKLK